MGRMAAVFTLIDYPEATKKAKQRAALCLKFHLGHDHDALKDDTVDAAG